MTLRALVDTNVLISALLGQSGDTPPQRVVEAALTGRFRPVCCDAIVREFLQVAQRPKLVALHREGNENVEKFMQRWIERAIHRTPAPTVLNAPDPGDQVLWELLAADPELLLISGDRRLLEARDFAGRKYTAADFLQVLD